MATNSCVTGFARAVTRSWRAHVVYACLALAVVAAPADAKAHKAKIPLHEGKASLADVSGALCRGLGVDPLPAIPGTLDLSGLRGSNFVAAVNESLGDACEVKLTKEELVLRIDPDKLPKDCEAASRAVRIFTAVQYPEAADAQRKHYGLHLPAQVDPGRPLVVLIHGVDSDPVMWGGLTKLLVASGYQVACFGYPGDAPIAESGALLGRHLADVRTLYPSMRVDLVCHSMGGLVARAFVESPDYAGGINRLILCGTPNAGSTWSKYRLALEVQEHYHRWRNDPNWSPTWMITDGLGEAGRDLRPGSAFLTKLNANPRRDGVRYTIVAGNRHPARSTCADWWECSARTLVPKRAETWWGFRAAKYYMEGKAAAVRAEIGDSDGPVLVESTKLAGVDDFVTVPADHASLCWGDAPAAWDVVRDRLAR